MAQYIYTMNRVSKIIAGGKTILKDISLSFLPGAKIGVLGLNGAGKSTLLKIIAGIDQEIDGNINVMQGIKIGYLPQDPIIDSNITVKDFIESSVDNLFKARQELNNIYELYADPNADFDFLSSEQARLEAILSASASSGIDDLDNRIQIAADALRLPDFSKIIGYLSGGEKRRVALCGVLLSKPDLLLLDEPTNHLDAESVDWLEKFLYKFNGTVIAVTHDRYFLDNVAEWILELDRGIGIPWKGNYSSWLEQKNLRISQEENSENSRKKTILKELEWIKQNPKARQVKSKARLNKFEELVSFEYQKRNETQDIFIPVGERLGNEVLELKNINMSYNNNILIKNLNFKLPAGSIVGIIGANGTGKTTLFDIITGKIQPNSGEVILGKTVKISFANQLRDFIDSEKTVFEVLSKGSDIIKIGKFELSSRAYLSKFNFKGSDQNKKIKFLSGGERGRLHLALSLVTGGNFLLLDEPSNDLDVETLRSLEDALLEFAGNIMVISHDRWFLDRISTHILAFEGNSNITFFDGNYSEYEKYKNQLSLQKKTFKYKGLK
ncbi:Energy-dependent translational throttle protein EttA [Candidatus Kinetoplastibacterium sorsogonicusi]|uniref:Energy-dependent translational throttle protein EttA n=1 Tax=Candidatus Kinetoplastidibacterium kentomonadis TaxID=1576550 RepID=A0A3S7JAH1_9PROT|nr:energy-dependent translational throttle protein EttA [Candidatus Kinetoplastibacterium sorsogonicusi]AWD32636.1 Energy-dependent translational throttle protein EttA [Candidatus Kinetoplastibacterium sorsogonicusi]